ncbi:hypothetical protein [Shimia sp.]|uniref:hypothetical protein n=1 Tax=Shimia sp. TaxID=1954381 RepID=UPI003B8C2812
MHFRPLVALALFSFISACDLINPSPMVNLTDAEAYEIYNGCKEEASCAVPKYLAATFQKNAGTSLDEGVILRGGRIVGNRTIFEVDTTEELGLIWATQSEARNFEEDILDLMRADYCDGDAVEEYINSGNQIEFRLYLPSGKLFSNSALTQC